MEIREATEIVARSIYKLNCKEHIHHSDDENWRDAEMVIRNVLNGDEPLAKYNWLIKDECYSYLEEEIRKKHGKLFYFYHNTIHFLKMIDEELDDGNIRKAQEIIETLAEKARVGMLLEKGYGC